MLHFCMKIWYPIRGNSSYKLCRKNNVMGQKCKNHVALNFEKNQKSVLSQKRLERKFNEIKNLKENNCTSQGDIKLIKGADFWQILVF